MPEGTYIHAEKSFLLCTRSVTLKPKAITYQQKNNLITTKNYKNNFHNIKQRDKRSLQDVGTF